MFACLGTQLSVGTISRKVLLDLEDRYIPLKKIRKVRGKKVKPIWMTNKALSMLEGKVKFTKKYKNNDHPAVKAANRSVTKEIKKAKRNFEKKLAHNI